MRQRQSIVQVDAFTDQPFAGNPAAVCVMSREAAASREARWMQLVAREMNLAETAFVVPRTHGPREFDLRWFTPAVEVDLCGHATLAAAHVLWEDKHVPRDERISFHTRSGVLSASPAGDGWIELDFPATPAEPCDPPPGLVEALGARPVNAVARSRFDYLLELASEAAVRALRPDFAHLAAIEARGVIVTAPAERGGRFDFISRFFAPRVGVNEDPVTGSAHCALGPWWCERLGKSELLAYQASERGGVVRVVVGGDRVLFGGEAVTVLRGELLA
jgi:predicted PhzF superfamily epimerase YddE/YHI9